MGSHRMITKTVIFEESARIPLLVKMPGQRQGRRVASSVSQVDLVPTILEALDVSPKVPLDGVSLVDACHGGEEPDRDVALVWHVDNGHDNSNNGIAGLGAQYGIDDDEVERHLRSEQRCLVTPDRWKIIRSAFGEVECYDLNNDPYELRNLAGDAEYANRIDELNGRLKAWQQRFEDPLFEGKATGHTI